MFNTLYNIAGGIALAIGALGASDDFDGAQLVQNAFFGPEEEGEIILDEQEMASEEVLVAKDIDEWNEIASKVMSMTLTGESELSNDEKLEIAVLTGEVPSDVSEEPVEVEQNVEISQPEGLSEEEFYSMLEHQYNDAMSALASEETKAESQPLVIEAVQEELTTVKLQPEDDVNAEKAFEDVASNSDSKDADNSDQVKEESEVNVPEMEPWIVVHGLPDIPEMDMNELLNQKAAVEQPVQTEQTALEDVNVQEIPVVDSSLSDISEVEVPEVDAAELEAPEVEVPELEVPELEAPEVDAAELEVPEVDASEIEVPEIDAPEIEVPEVDASEIEVPEIDAPEIEESEVPPFGDSDAEEAENENADIDDSEAKETENEGEASIEDLDIEVPELEDFGAPQFDDPESADAQEDIVEPLEDDAENVETNDEALLIPSIDIPPAVVTEEERAKISAEVDAIANQSDNFDGWIPRQIPVSGTVDDAQPQTKPEDDFIQNFSKQNVKETILENNGIDLK